MTRLLALFSGCFLLGALFTLAVRTARHDPHVQPGAEVPAPAAALPALPSAAPSSAPTAVNTVCALCGMAVDPKIPTALYQGRIIGFGCKACPPRFAADPERYGPAALANQVVE